MTLTRIGTQVYWFLPENLVVDSATLARHGFENVAPENAPRARLLKACDVLKGSWQVELPADDAEATHLAGRVDRRRHHDGTHTRVSFYRPVHGQRGEAPKLVVAFTAVLDKAMAKAGRVTEALTFERGDIDEHELVRRTEEIRQLYLHGDTLSSKQFREAVTRFVLSTSGCNGVSMRIGSGGVYLVPLDFDDRLAQLARLFDDVAETYRRTHRTMAPHLTRLNVYDDEEGTAEAHRVTVAHFEREFDAFTTMLAEEAAKGELSPRKFEARLDAADELRQRVTMAERYLSEQAETFRERAGRLLQVLETKIGEASGKVITPFDLLAELTKIEEST